MSPNRNRASAKAAGSRFERLIADHLATVVDDRIDRRVKTGAKDRGDLGGIRLSPALHGGHVVAELKDCSPRSPSPTCGSCLALGAWSAEAEAERGNDDAIAGVMIHKRHGVGAPGKQWVTMTVDDFAAILTGMRPPLEETIALAREMLSRQRASKRAHLAEPI